MSEESEIWNAHVQEAVIAKLGLVDGSLAESLNRMQCKLAKCDSELCNERNEVIAIRKQLAAVTAERTALGLLVMAGDESIKALTAERNTLKAALEECSECCGDEHKKGYVPVSELQPTIEFLVHLIIGLGFANPETTEGRNLWAWRDKSKAELSRLEALKGKHA